MHATIAAPTDFGQMITFSIASRTKINIEAFLQMLDDNTLSGHCTEPEGENYRSIDINDARIGGGSWSAAQRAFKYEIHSGKFHATINYKKNGGGRNVESLSIKSKSDTTKSISVCGSQLLPEQASQLLSKCDTIVTRTIAKRHKEEQAKFDNIISLISA